MEESQAGLLAPPLTSGEADQRRPTPPDSTAPPAQELQPNSITGTVVARAQSVTVDVSCLSSRARAASATPPLQKC